MKLIDTVAGEVPEGATPSGVFYNDLIFKRIAEKNVLTWLTEDDGQTLDYEYYLNHSGTKLVSPMFYRLRVMVDDDTITEEDMYDFLINSILLKYKDKWNRLYDAFIQEQYNPIENYSMTENENTGVNVMVETNQQNEVYGFNSVEAVPNQNADAVQTTKGNKADNERSLIRSGNIGVTTSQQMLESEIELRKWNFYQEMMSDVDKILTLSVY